MEGNIVFKIGSGSELAFNITNEHLWMELYHKVAFLAESGIGVSFIEGGEE